MCSRSHGTPPNCTACVTSWKITQSASSSRSASMVSATASMLGPTKSSRGGTDGSSSASSYWPITRRPTTPSRAPISADAR